MHIKINHTDEYALGNFLSVGAMISKYDPEVEELHSRDLRDDLDPTGFLVMFDYINKKSLTILGVRKLKFDHIRIFYMLQAAYSIASVQIISRRFMVRNRFF